jgi:hypothetical protein
MMYGKKASGKAMPKDSNNPKKKGVMTEKQVKQAKASYKTSTGMDYKPKTSTVAKAPRVFKSKAAKDAWFAKNAPDRMNKTKKK